jgi:hypothetical protein
MKATSTVNKESVPTDETRLCTRKRLNPPKRTESIKNPEKRRQKLASPTVVETADVLIERLAMGATPPTVTRVGVPHVAQ